MAGDEAELIRAAAERLNAAEARRTERVRAAGSRCAAYWGAHRPEAELRAKQLLARYDREGPLPQLIGGAIPGSSERALTFLLAWLLDPSGRHGCGSAVLVALLDRCGLPADALPRDARAWRVDRERRVRRHGSSGGKDEPDLVIHGPDVVVVIEHKVDAPETGNQYPRYRELMKHRWTSRTHRKLVFLRTGAPHAADAKLGDMFDATLDRADLASVIRRARAGLRSRAAQLLDSVLVGLRPDQGDPRDAARTLRRALDEPEPSRLVGAVRQLEIHLEV